MTKQDDIGREFLKSFFGYDDFRENQEEIIKAICRGQDVFAVMPTGGGKSLCYQFPAVALDGTCVVISPLLSLMKDQVDSARDMGIRAATINSATSVSEYRKAMSGLEQNELDLLYISPERFSNETFVERLKQYRVSFFAVDEAHCISEWGHQFRPDYLELGRISEVFPNVPIAAFTATATQKVAEDIKSRLNLRNPFLVRASFDRPNLDYSVVYKDNLNKQLLDFLKTVPNEPGIIYRGTRKSVEETAEYLKKNGYSALPYHAGMSSAERNKIQEAFSYDRAQIIVATIAFGMGIDKPNVRFVVHGDLPKNIEGYYQETGRAGRDGAPSQCLLLFGYQDVIIHRAFIDQYEYPDVRRTAMDQLNKMIAFAEADECRRKAILRYFGEEYKSDNCGHCDYCREAIKHCDATIDAQKALSAMQRTGNNFGIGHISDILVAADTERIRKFRHNLLPTYGVGKGKTKQYWRFLINALICKGAAAMKPNCDFPIPQVTSLGVRIMKGEEKFSIVEFVHSSKSEKGKKSSRTKNENQGKNSLKLQDRELFELLRFRRKEIAAERNIPPYFIFNDSSLIEMAERRPMTSEELLGISGVTDKKMDMYGEDFLEVIEDYINSLPEPE